MILDNGKQEHYLGARIGYLDALKCFGIILVIEGHVRGFGLNIGSYDSLSGLMLYSFNMPLFFFISGLLAYKTNNCTIDILKKINNKFIRLVIPAIIFYIFRALQLQANPFDFFVNGVGGYWFTITRLECFMLYYMVRLLTSSSLIHDSLLFFLAFLGLASLSIYGEFGPKLLDMDRLTKYFHFFVLGIFAMKYKFLYMRIVNCEWMRFLAVIFYFGLLFTVNYSNWPDSVFHFLRDIVLRYLGLFLVISWFACHENMFDADNVLNKVALNVGRKSLPVYLLHFFFLPNTLAFCSIEDGVDVVTAHIIYSLFILAICYLFITLLSNSIIIRRYFLGLK